MQEKKLTSKTIATIKKILNNTIDLLENESIGVKEFTDQVKKIEKLAYQLDNE